MAIDGTTILLDLTFPVLFIEKKKVFKTLLLEIKNLNTILPNLPDFASRFYLINF